MNGAARQQSFYCPLYVFRVTWPKVGHSRNGDIIHVSVRLSACPGLLSFLPVCFNCQSIPLSSHVISYSVRFKQWIMSSPCGSELHRLGRLLMRLSRCVGNCPLFMLLSGLWQTPVQLRSLVPHLQPPPHPLPPTPYLLFSLYFSPMSCLNFNGFYHYSRTIID